MQKRFSARTSLCASFHPYFRIMWIFIRMEMKPFRSSSKLRIDTKIRWIYAKCSRALSLSLLLFKACGVHTRTSYQYIASQFMIETWEHRFSEYYLWFQTIDHVPCSNIRPFRPNINFGLYVDKIMCCLHSKHSFVKQPARTTLAYSPQKCAVRHVVSLGLLAEFRSKIWGCRRLMGAMGDRETTSTNHSYTAPDRTAKYSWHFVWSIWFAATPHISRPNRGATTKC